MIDIDISLPLAHFDLVCRATLTSRVTALAGSSGAGKTSLIEALAGLRKNVRGRISIDGEVVLDSDRRIFLPPEKRRIGYMPQDGLLFPHLTVRRNLLFGAAPGKDIEQVVTSFEIVHLLARYPESLSGGERQRVSLARALMSSPRLLLLDEPLSSIDQPLREKLLVYLRRVRDSLRVPMIYVTHQIVEALAMSDDALVLDRGRVLALGPADTVLHRREVAGRDSVQNVFELRDPRHSPDQGVTVATTAQGMSVSIPHEQVAGATFPLMVSIDGEEILLFSRKPESLSARTIVEGTIRSLVRNGGTADVEVATRTPLRVRITSSAADELQLAEDQTVWLALKTWGFRILG
ncbi:MAG TPA: molybdenum ABC transporter ATP-binding protein [Thermoanaerobaculia bacterium]|nr:molybdenum ABC transporter ATP-binding protein [Thermoanaerobaculia bacterium]